MPQNPGDKLVILERRKNVARRYMRGETQWEIARAFEVAQTTVSNDLKAIREEWIAQSILDMDEIKARELAKIDEVERLAFGAWTKSQENAEINRVKTRTTGGETEKVSKGQAGDPRFLDIILKCVEKRCRILGLDAMLSMQDEVGVRLILTDEVVYVEDQGHTPPDQVAPDAEAIPPQ